MGQQSYTGNGNAQARVSSSPLDELVQPAIHPKQESVNRAEGFQLMRGIPESVHKGMHDYGYKVARESGNIEPREVTREAVEEYARKAARELYRDEFDPNLFPHDRMHESEYEKHLRDRELAEEAEMNAAAAVREREKKVAESAAGDAPASPDSTIWWVVGGLCAVAIAVSIVLTLQGTFFASLDTVISWYVAFITGTVIGLAIVLLILADDDTGHSTAKNWVGLASAIIIGIAFGGARMRDAVEFNDYFFASTLGLLEIGIAIGLFGVAGSRRNKLHQYAQELAVYTAKVENEKKENALLAASVAEHQRRQQRVQETNNAIKGDIHYREERAERNLNIDKIEEATVTAAIAGYDAGIAANRAYVLGAKER
jgi:hypothetical protein